MHKTNKLQLATLIAICLLALPAFGVELISDGDFEGQAVPDGAPAMAPWNIAVQPGSNGTSFHIDTPGSTTPQSAFNTSATPANGQRYAVSDQFGPGAVALLQSFTVPTGTTALTLSFDLFVNDYDGGPIIDPAGLDYMANPNQHARVDILTTSAAPLSTAPVDVVFNVLPPFVSPNPDPNAFTTYTLPLPLLPPGTYQLRFAEVDNQGNLNMGVDNVSLTAVPEPATVIVAGMALMATGRRMRRRSSR